MIDSDAHRPALQRPQEQAGPKGKYRQWRLCEGPDFFCCKKRYRYEAVYLWYWLDETGDGGAVYDTEIDHVMQAGKKNRSVGSTLMNQSSSRSHSIFTIVVECAESDDRGDHIRVGKLNLVDLAGSERQGKVSV